MLIFAEYSCIPKDNSTLFNPEAKDWGGGNVALDLTIILSSTCIAPEVKALHRYDLVVIANGGLRLRET